MEMKNEGNGNEGNGNEGNGVEKTWCFISVLSDRSQMTWRSWEISQICLALVSKILLSCTTSSRLPKKAPIGIQREQLTVRQ
jgi:hypothetical protein